MALFCWFLRRRHVRPVGTGGSHRPARPEPSSAEKPLTCCEMKTAHLAAGEAGRSDASEAS
ncbi:hypothetical protein MBEBAB_2857 [Brevundimonas abyssalis TAR-001]|uniref:Uncharacterized protein n=1 Tax=Brevundimonas abyssalis TAR-001 TaxID=1391729 RepID=A0A8E0TSL9_9CAUL|nr:hypothetical protein MBEBAB_2857 [Brevundimonas abyssalis TAR-001]